MKKRRVEITEMIEIPVPVEEKRKRRRKCSSYV